MTSKFDTVEYILAELLYVEIKKNIRRLEIMVNGSDNSDMLGIDEFELFENIISKLLEKQKEEMRDERRRN